MIDILYTVCNYLILRYLHKSQYLQILISRSDEFTMIKQFSALSRFDSNRYVSSYILTFEIYDF